MKALTAIFSSMLVMVSCSTTAVLQKDQFRLASNKIEIEGKSVKESELLPYVRQQANTTFIFGWSPGLCIYNWSGGKDSWIGNIFKKIGQAPVVFNQSMVKTSENNLKDHMAHLGFYNAKVSSKVSKKNKIARVRYHITPGNRHKIGSVSYCLPDDSLFRKVFLADTINTLICPGAYLSENLVEQEFARNRSILRDNGYFDIQKEDYSFVADTFHNSAAKVEYFILKDSIKLYRFGKTSIDNIGGRFRKNTFQKIVTIKDGDIFKDSELSKTYQRICSIPAIAGANITTKTNDDLTIDTDINIHPAKTRGFKFEFEASFTSTGLMGFSPKISYFNKNIFHGAEMLELSFSGNFQNKPSTGAKSNEFGVSAKIKKPNSLLFNNIHSNYLTFGEYGASFNRQMRPEYTRNVISLNLGYSGHWGEKTIFRINPIQINYVQLQNISDSFRETLTKNPLLRYSYTDHGDLGIWTTINYSTDHSIVPQVSYKYINVDVQTAGNALSLLNKVLPTSTEGRKVVFNVPYSQYVRLEAKFGRNWRFGSDNGQAIAMRLIAGAAYSYGNSESVPFEKKFYVGGAESLRGWQARAVGPGHSPIDRSFIIPSQAGDLKLEFDAEYRFKMFWKVEGALFAEAGNVWEYSSMQKFWEDIAGDWGVGLRLNLNFIVIRLDYGFKVHDPSGEYDGRKWLGPGYWFQRGAGTLHFGVGYPF